MNTTNLAAFTNMEDFLSAAAHHFEQNRHLIPMEIHLLLSALFPIYIGAHASLSRPASAAKPEPRAAKTDEDDEGDDEEESIQKLEGLTASDALIFPLTAACVLAGLYWAIKAYGADTINLILGVYFSVVGIYSVTKLINDTWATIQSFITPAYYHDSGKLWKAIASKRKVIALHETAALAAARSSPLGGLLGRIPLPRALVNLLWLLRDLTKQKFSISGYMKDVFEFQAIITPHNVLSIILGLTIIAYSFLIENVWWLTNIQGFAVSYGALQLMSPTTFATGSLILSGLFFYDIWAVFFTPLMTTVAKNLDVPIKLVFPRPDEPSARPGEPPMKNYSMLGLGDIVLPGLMIALALRFDLYMFYQKKQKKISERLDISSSKEKIVKAPYVSVTGNWGEKVWTVGTTSASKSGSLPAQLRSRFPKPYFTATMIGYVIGMVATLGFMVVFRHAQPALLYLVPSVLVSLWGTGLMRGEIHAMWNFSEAITGEAIDDEDEDKPKKSDNDDVESTSIISTVWSQLFGVNEQQGPDQSARKSEGLETKLPHGKKTKSSKRSEFEKDDIFSLKVSRHFNKIFDSTNSAQKSNTVKTTDGIENTNASQNNPSDSAFHDTVSINQGDLDDSETTVEKSRNVQEQLARYRTTSVQGGEAEKRTRLS